MTLANQLKWEKLADKALAGEKLSMEEGLSVLNAPDEELLLLLHASFRVRYHYFGKKVKLNMIINAKSGLCSEDCGYCSQSAVSEAPVEKYSLLRKEDLIEGAKTARARKAGTYCIVASGRGPTRRELNEVIDAVKEIKEKYPLKICTCLGIVSDEQAKQLKEAGVDRYNHNLNTSATNYGNIATTHTYQDRVDTVQTVKIAGISPCSGCIIGMGETKEQVVEMAYSLRELDADSIPVNFLNAIPGTPLQGMKELNPRYCLKVLALFRFICAQKEIRVSGGREVNLRQLQPLSLYPANSLFVGDYLTTEGQESNLDLQMIEDMGFEVEEATHE
ncbi:biotin synthase BioB [Thermoactinomyces mirandus]|uniref:Biotin synthase n=1 Tax=Thermoactinomyces mirandus TaxID=2756294 RepID=A0A7W1XS42_9BACL|nr:biotin synthase BioB [Thermoactinomyces mirandus]MBA4602176.1 biotin synthase BioB [Thermoactinomyces mirandus]